MGKLFIAAEFFDQAQACLANAQLLRPDEMQWPYLLGHVFRFQNDIPRAAGAFGEALTLAPNHVPTLVWLAEMHLAQSQADQAEPLLIKAQSLDAESGAVRFVRGRLALARQDYAQAVTHLEAALARGPQATRIHYPLALAYRGLGDRRKAEEHLALRGEVDLPPIDPILEGLGNLLENAAAYETRGSKAIEARQWPEAVANLQKAVSLEPGNALTHLNLGTALYMQRDADGALAEYRAATRLSPSLAKAHFGIGVILETRNQDREAIEAFTAAVTSDPASLEARFSLAQALRRNGRVEQSLPHYEYILQSQPGGLAGGFRTGDGARAAGPLSGGAGAAGAGGQEFSRSAGLRTRPRTSAGGGAGRPDPRRRTGRIHHGGAAEDTADARDGRDYGDGLGRSRTVRRGGQVAAGHDRRGVAGRPRRPGEQAHGEPPPLSGEAALPRALDRGRPRASSRPQHSVGAGSSMVVSRWSWSW